MALAAAGLTGVAAPVAASSAIEAVDRAHASAVSDVAQRAELVAFDYGRFVTRAYDLGLPRQTLAFTLTVGADGKVSECDFSRQFRSAFTPAELCDRLKLTMTFRPARDAQGNPVGDVYSNEVMIWSLITPDR